MLPGTSYFLLFCSVYAVCATLCVIITPLGGMLSRVPSDRNFGFKTFHLFLCSSLCGTGRGGVVHFWVKCPFPSPPPSHFQYLLDLLCYFMLCFALYCTPYLIWIVLYCVALRCILFYFILFLRVTIFFYSIFFTLRCFHLRYFSLRMFCSRFFFHSVLCLFFLFCLVLTVE